MKLKILPAEKVKPTFRLTIHYMIGDADGSKDFDCDFVKLDEVLIKLIRLLEKLKGYRPKGHLGFIFDNQHLNLALKERKLTQEDINFFNDNSEDLWDIVRDSYCDEREFLVYKGFDIIYIDENGVSHPVKVIDEL